LERIIQQSKKIKLEKMRIRRSTFFSDGAVWLVFGG